MSLLPLPSRLPARKHLLAAGFGLLGVALMVGAVMNASGLTLPFTSGEPERVRAGSVVVDAPNPTTTTQAPSATTSTTPNPDRSRALAPVAIPAPTTTAPPARPRQTPPPSTSTTLPAPSVPTLLPPLGLGGL
jgi:hypothetical protein